MVHITVVAHMMPYHAMSAAAALIALNIYDIRNHPFGPFDDYVSTVPAGTQPHAQFLSGMDSACPDSAGMFLVVAPH